MALRLAPLTLPFEDPDQLDLLRAELEEELMPRSGIESQLVDSLATLIWRYRRVAILEAEVLRAQCAEIAQAAEPTPTESKEICWRLEFVKDGDHLEEIRRLKERKLVLRQEIDRFEKEGICTRCGGSDKGEPACNQIGATLLKNGLSLDTLSRYENGLANRIAKTLQLLILLQSRDESRGADPV